jgi:hypothetical protein
MKWWKESVIRVKTASINKQHDGELFLAQSSVLSLAEGNEAVISAFTSESNFFELFEESSWNVESTNLMALILSPFRGLETFNN